MEIPMLLRDEILEQPAVLEGAISENSGVAADARDLLKSEGVHHVVIAARGTSDNAARYAKYVWGARLGLPVTLAAPSLYTRYRQHPDLGGAAVVGISQSGQSPDLLAVVEQGRRTGRPTLALTNDVDSPLAQMSDVVVPLHAAPETSIAATKSYTASLLAIAMIAAEGDSVESVPDIVQKALDAEPEIKNAAARQGAVSKGVVLGRGYNHATAFEWAIKMQEMAYVLAHAYSTADFAHGPFALLEPEFPVFAIVGKGALTEDGLAIVRRARDEAGAAITVMTNTVIPDLPTIDLPDIEEWLSPMMFIAACQLFTLYTAIENGVDPESPRGLAKVTKTA
jgi:glucosamine--fructose-6-phosphate aminotransferase (isomerizing)